MIEFYTHLWYLPNVVNEPNQLLMVRIQLEKKFIYVHLANNVDNINSSVFSKRLYMISNNTRLVKIFFYIFINENYSI